MCRGEIDLSSDIDLLAIVEGNDANFNPNDYSIYSYSRIEELWREGNPFAWHLFLEAKMIFSSDKSDFMQGLGKPASYTNGVEDCKKFKNIFISACKSLDQSTLTQIFDYSSVFLSIRNFASCFSLTMTDKPDFSRNSALRLAENSLLVDAESYHLMERCRVLCTRGKGDLLNTNEIIKMKISLEAVDRWMSKLMQNIEEYCYERI